MYDTYKRGDCNAAVSKWRRILELSSLYEIAETPVVVKEALHMIHGKIKPVTRPPLLPLDDEKRLSIKSILRSAGLLA